MLCWLRRLSLGDAHRPDKSTTRTERSMSRNVAVGVIWLSSLILLAFSAACKDTTAIITVTDAALVGVWVTTSWYDQSLPVAVTCLEASNVVNNPGTVWTDTVTDYRIIMSASQSFTVSVAQAHRRSDLPDAVDVASGTYSIQGNNTVTFNGTRSPSAIGGAAGKPFPFQLTFRDGHLIGQLQNPRCSSEGSPPLGGGQHGSAALTKQ